MRSRLNLDFTIFTDQKSHRDWIFHFFCILLQPWRLAQHHPFRILLSAWMARHLLAKLSLVRLGWSKAIRSFSFCRTFFIERVYPQKRINRRCNIVHVIAVNDILRWCKVLVYVVDRVCFFSLRNKRIVSLSPPLDISTEYKRTVLQYVLTTNIMYAANTVTWWAARASTCIDV